MRFKWSHQVWIAFILIGATLVGATGAAAQSIYWKKDYITDEAGRVIATATPLPADQVAPSAPAGLNYSNLTYTSVTLQWTGSSDTGGSGLAGYKIYRGSLPVAAVTGTSYTDNDLQPYATYVYSIVAFDVAGNHSNASNNVSVTTALPPNAPSNLSASVVSSSQINLSWVDNSSDETGFKIERKTGAGGTWSQINTAGANVTSYPDTGLSGSTTYYYRVRAYGPGGDSAYSNEASATTPAPQPTSLSISPSSLSQGQCYTMTVGNGANMTLDVQYTFNGGAPQQVNSWPQLNSNAQFVQCTSWMTQPGTYLFIKIRNHLNTDWVTVNSSVTVVPAQLTSFSISPSTVHQGDCYTITVGNATNMTLDVKYTFNGGPQQQISAWPALNANGQYVQCTDLGTPTGTYAFVAAKNVLRDDWVSIYAPVTVVPPQPASFDVYPSALTQGQCYTITVSNGAYMTLDIKYTYNGGPVQEIDGWPSLNGNGQYVQCTDSGTPTGTYAFVAARNSLNTDWVGVYAPVTVYPQ